MAITPTQQEIDAFLLKNPSYNMTDVQNYATKVWATLPWATPTYDVWQSSTWVNTQGETTYNFWPTPTPTQTVLQPTPVQPAPTTPVGSVSSILGDMGDDQFTTDYYNRLRQEYDTPIDENAVYQEKLKQNQAQIDAVNALYADRLRSQQVISQGNLGSNRAIQARSGLLGSDFGSAQTGRIQQSNQQAENLVENERLAVVQQILTGARESAAAEIAAKRQAINEWGKALLDYYAGAGDRKNAKISKAAQLLLSLGKTPNDVSDSELAQAGINRNELTALYNEGKSAIDAANAKAQQEQQKLDLEWQKTMAEIAKIQQDVANWQLDRTKYYEVGNKIYEQGTNKFIADATFNPYSGAFQVSPWNQVFNPVTNTFSQAPVMGQGATGDLRGYRSQYPNEAWSATNNPGGISAWPGSSFVNLLQQNGIQIAGYSQRPEWGAPYVVFPTIEEGMKAYNLLWSQPSYQNLTVGQALQRWGTGALPGVDTNKLVSQLTTQELQALQSAQIRKESPGLYKVMQGGAGGDIIAQYDLQRWPEYENYNNKWVIPKDVADRAAFKQEALAYKYESIGRESQKYLDSVDKLLNATVSRKERLAINTSPTLASLKWEYADILNAYNNLISKLNIKSLTDAKAQGATFGQLSNQELKVLWDAATSLKLNSSDAEWKIQIARIGNALLKASGQAPKYNEQTGEVLSGSQTSTPPSTGQTDAYAQYLKAIWQ